jgi:hypothetical protein
MMTAEETGSLFADPPLTGDARLVRDVTDLLGGRFSAELGIDVDAGDDEVERWFLAATLFGARISAGVAEHAFTVLDAAGLKRIDQARHVPAEDLVRLLDEGGYARYDFRTASQLRILSELIDERFDGQVAVIGERYQVYPALWAALIVLPGWGQMTIQLFLRELRGVWRGAQPPLDWRGVRQTQDALSRIAGLATAAGLDVRDLEAGLVRLDLAHRRLRRACPGGSRCAVLRSAAIGAEDGGPEDGGAEDGGAEDRSVAG